MNILNLFNKNIKKYGHIISLGYNCEVAYQFFKYHHFVESSLFAWSNTINIENLIYALNNLDKLTTGEVQNAIPMWECINTKIRFHGKAPMNIWFSENTPTDDLINSDREELIARINHLKEKFIITSNDKKKNLYIFKYLILEKDTFENISKAITELYSALKNIVNNEFDLLFIFEESELFQKLKQESFDKHIYLKSVKFFAPEDNVTGKINDTKGWKKIFDEFKPNFKLKKTKKFKFEDV